VRFLLDYVDRRQVYQALLAAINLGNEEIAGQIPLLNCPFPWGIYNT